MTQLPDRDLPIVGMLCRDYQHSWAPARGGKEKGGWFRTLICQRCGTERREHLDKWGFVESRSYSYPEGFLVKGGGPLTQDERGFLRLLNIDPEARIPKRKRPTEPGEPDPTPAKKTPAKKTTTARKTTARKPAGPSKTARLDKHLKDVQSETKKK